MTTALPTVRPGRRVAAAFAALGLAGIAALGAALPASATAPTAAPPATLSSIPTQAAHLAPAGAVATDTADPTVTWAVQPADEDGPDGRRFMELELDPGAVVTEHLAVRNFGEDPVTFALSAADGYLTERGRFNMLSDDEESVDGGTWIDVQESVTVPGGETTVVPFTITVPADATPGDHPAGIAASIQSESGTVGLQSRLGFRVMMRATGEVQPVLTVPEVKASYTPSWNPFAPGEVRVSYDVANEGNVRLGADSAVETSALFGLATQEAAAEPMPEILPGGSMSRTVEVDQVWPLGPVTTTVTVTPVPVAETEIDAAELEPVTTTVTTWAIPLPQLLLLAILLVLFLGIRDERRRRRKRLEDMLAKARDEGRRAAAERDRADGGSVTTTDAAPGETAGRTGGAAKGEPTT